jgi:hypothetical protein
MSAVQKAEGDFSAAVGLVLFAVVGLLGWMAYRKWKDSSSDWVHPDLLFSSFIHGVDSGLSVLPGFIGDPLSTGFNKWTVGFWNKVDKLPGISKETPPDTSAPSDSDITVANYGNGDVEVSSSSKLDNDEEA